MKMHKSKKSIIKKIFSLQRQMIADGTLYVESRKKHSFFSKISRILTIKKYSHILHHNITQTINNLRETKVLLSWKSGKMRAYREEAFQFLYKNQNIPDAFTQIDKKLNKVSEEELQKKYEKLKSLIIDYYIALVTLNDIKKALCIKTKTQLHNELDEIISNELPVPTHYSGTNIEKLIDQISQATIFEQAWNLYNQHKNFLKDVTFVKYNDRSDKAWKVIDLYRLFGVESRSQIYSIFYKGQVNCITRGTLLREKNISLNEYCVVLDANVASYLRSANIGRKETVNINGIKNFIHNTPGVEFDYIPFIIEKRLSETYNETSLFNDVFNIEQLYFSPAHKTYDFCKNEAQKQLKAVEFILPQFMIWYKKVYARLLIIVWSCLRFWGKPRKQYEEMCLLLSEELHDYPIPELSMAYDFCYHHSVPFLNCIQKTTKDLIKRIKNMAWDILHLRSLYERSKVLDGGEISFHFFYTFDVNLTKIIKYFELDALAVCTQTGEYFPYFHVNNVPKAMIEKYFLDIDANISIDTDSIIKKYENLIETVS